MDVKISGGSQVPLWYFLVVWVQAMTLIFPFSQAMSLTRSESYRGSLAAAAVSGLGMSLIFVLLGLVLVGLVALVILRQAWSEVGAWILDTGSLGLTM